MTPELLLPHLEGWVDCEIDCVFLKDKEIGPMGQTMNLESVTAQLTLGTLSVIPETWQVPLTPHGRRTADTNLTSLPLIAVEELRMNKCKEGDVVI